MKNIELATAIVLIVAGAQLASGQASNPQERKAFREYTSPQELVSISPSTPMDKALAAIGEVSQKFIGKIIIDTEHRTMPINIDIQGMQWRDALEAICRKNDLWYNEFENYLQITGAPGAEGGVGQVGKPGGPGGGPAPSVDIQREYVTFRSREVKISAVFLEVDLTRVEEVGINWNFIKNENDYTINSNFAGADRLSTQMFKTDVTFPSLKFANISFLASMFSNYDLGQILSSPQLVVRSGEEGRIQVGADFSVKERDFAGNLIDRFYSTGTIITIKPQVISEQGVNFIHLTANVERSSVTPGTVSTIINKSTAKSDLLLLDGEETIIGGLYDNETDETRSGVPFLKDLPWYVFGLRYIFGYSKETVTKKELVILLKAELVPSLQERITQKVKEEGMFDRWLDERLKQQKNLTGNNE